MFCVHTKHSIVVRVSIVCCFSFANVCLRLVFVQYAVAISCVFFWCVLSLIRARRTQCCVCVCNMTDRSFKFAEQQQQQFQKKSVQQQSPSFIVPSPAILVQHTMSSTSGSGDLQRLHHHYQLSHLADEAVKAEVKQEDESDSDAGHTDNVAYRQFRVKSPVIVGGQPAGDDTSSYYENAAHMHGRRPEFTTDPPLPPPPPPPPPAHVSYQADDILLLPPPALDHTIYDGSSTTMSPQHSQSRVYGRLTYKDTVLNISDSIVEIGRNSTTSSVHFHVGKSSFVSRKHLQVAHIHHSGEFYLTCLSKNGVFVDDVFQRKSSQPLQLPKT